MPRLRRRSGAGAEGPDGAHGHSLARPCRRECAKWSDAGTRSVSAAHRFCTGVRVASTAMAVPEALQYLDIGQPSRADQSAPASRSRSALKPTTFRRSPGNSHCSSSLRHHHRCGRHGERAKPCVPRAPARQGDRMRVPVRTHEPHSRIRRTAKPAALGLPIGVVVFDAQAWFLSRGQKKALSPRYVTRLGAHLI